MNLKPIKTKDDYEAALREIERLWGAAEGTPAGDRLDILATLVDAYEEKHFPMDLPDPIEAINFRLEQQGERKKRPHRDHWKPDPRLRSSPPRSPAFPGNDPPTEQATENPR